MLHRQRVPDYYQCAVLDRCHWVTQRFCSCAAVVPLLTVALLGIAGCVSQQTQVGQKEDLLAAAGFQMRPAGSPHCLAAMKTLPPNRFVIHIRNGSPVYRYADPLDCDCLYFGTQQNWDAYKQEMFARQIANENQMTAIMNQQDWDWGPWGFP